MKRNKLESEIIYNRNWYRDSKNYFRTINICGEIHKNEFFILPSFSISIVEEVTEYGGKYIIYGLRLHWLMVCYSINYDKW
jgi:hypothetical protein